MDIARTIYYSDDDTEDLQIFKMAAESVDADVKLFELADDMLKEMNNPLPAPSIVFIDLNMPGKDGYKIISEIKQSETLRAIPIVVLSTASDNASVLKSRELGANYFIQKPPSVAKLRKAIEHTLTINWEKFKPTYGEFIHKH